MSHLTNIQENLNKLISYKNINVQSREKWLKKTIKKIPSKNKILDAGAGELQYKKYCDHLRYTSQDFAQYDGIGDKVGLQTKTWNNTKIDIVSDIVNIPIKNNSFDAVMCIEVLEHLPSPELAIKEFSRIIKKKGKLILTAPFCSLTHFSPYYYSNGFSEYWYKEILKKYGFKIIEIKKNGNYFDYMAQESYRLSEMNDNYQKDKLPSMLIKIISLINVILYKTMSKKNKKSENLLYFGTHVLAEKI